jgi:hypothetical protein
VVLYTHNACNYYQHSFAKLFSSCKTEILLARHQWLTPVILATQEAEIRGIAVQSQNRKKKKCLQDPISKLGLVEWLKVKALNSSLSTAKTNKQNQNQTKKH